MTPETMRPLRALYVWLAVPLVTSAAAAQTTEPLYTFGDPPAWIDVAMPDYEARIEESRATDGALVLLFDRQIDVRDDGDQQYHHVAVRVLNPVGVDAWSQIDVPVDPGYQSLVIHWLRVVRGDRVVDQRERARFTALPQEDELRNRIYNGRYDVDVLLFDVRPGDVVEYAYTLTSRERLFPGHYSAKLYTGWSTPLVRERIRIRSPLDRPLSYRLSNDEVPPAADVRDEHRELVLEWTDVAPIPADGNRPGWYDPWPYLEVSDLDDWQEVSHLVAPLFTKQQPRGERLAAVVGEIRAPGGTPHEQALRALQFVQDQVRYASISIGRGSHEPAHPETVLERRFGDCKDKSLLLVSILGQLGIEARTALVHSTFGRGLDAALPTPYAFDHAIVHARIDGEEYWLDPTAATRYSPLAADDPADFERALLVGETSAGLLHIPKPAPGTRQRDLRMEFDLRAGIEERASLVMTTWYRGRLADAMRSVLAQGSPEQRQVDYTNYIARYYPGATSSGPISIDDDKSANVIEVREHYALPRSFSPDEDGVLTFYLHADELYRFGEPLQSSVRSAPLALEYPSKVRQNLVVRLPEEWTIQPTTVTVENPAFRYRGDVSYAAQTLELDYEYEALADHVKLADLPRYEQDRQRFYDDTGYNLWYDPRAVSGGTIAPLPVVSTVVAVLFAAWAAVRWGYRYDPEPKVAPSGAPSGIGGWLLLPALGIILGPFLYGWVMVAWAPFFTTELWQTLPTITSEGWRNTAQLAMLGIEVFAAALLVGSVLLAFLFFGKRTSAPVLFVVLSWISLCFGNVVAGWAVLSGLDTETSRSELLSGAIRDTVGVAVWTAYMLASRRVRATFVRRLARRRDDAIALEARTGTVGFA